MDLRGLLVIAAAVAIAVYGARLERRPSPYTTGSGGYASQERIGARNHSGAEPYDLFGLRQRGW